MAIIFGLTCDMLASAGKFDTLFQLALLPVILIGFVTAIVWFVRLLDSADRHRWKRVVSALAAAPAAFLAMPGLWSNFDLASEVRLIVNRIDYDREITMLHDPVGRRQARWYWGGDTTAVTGGDLNWLVYDETDSLPAELCSGHPWPDANRSWFSPDHLEPRAGQLWGHFYLVRETVG